MSLPEQITTDLKSAMLAHESQTVSVLRLLNSEIKNAAIANGQPLTDDQIIQLIRKEIKKRNEAATAYQAAGQPDRASAEEGEATILSKYLPAAVDTAVLEQFIREQAEQYQPLEPRHKGELIKAAMAKFPGQVDGKSVSDIVQKLY